jgi:hypothetical protein
VTRTRAVEGMHDVLGLDKATFKSEKDSLFQTLRKAIEIVIGYYNGTKDIKLKDECRKVRPC